MNMVVKPIGNNVDKQRTLFELSDTPRSVRSLARACSFVFAVCMVATVFAPWQQSVDGTGRVIAYAPLNREQYIEAPLEGRVVHWWVHEGEAVRKGDRILDMSDNDPEIFTRLRQEREGWLTRRIAAQERVEAIEGRIVNLISSRQSAMGGSSARVQMAKRRIDSARQALEGQKAAFKTAEANFERQAALFEKGLSSKRAFEVAEQQFLEARAQLDSRHAALEAAQAEEISLQNDQLKAGTDGAASIDDARAALNNAQAEVASADISLANIDMRLARQNTQMVRASRDGVILRIIAKPGGEIAKAGDPLAVLVPKTNDRAVELWIAGNDVPLITPGRKARIQFEGWPAVQFVGWPSVAVGTFEGRVKFVDATDDGMGKFRVVILPIKGQPWPSPTYLRQGVRAQGWVLLNEVSVGFELWRRINAFPISVAKKEPKESNDAIDKK